MFYRLYKAVLFFPKLILNGFRNSSTARKLLLVVVIKLVIMFVVLKLFFFRDFLGSRFQTDEQKSEYVINQLTQKK